MITSKADFLAASSRKRETVDIDGVGQVELVELDLAARGELMAFTREKKDAAAQVVVLRACVPFLADATDEEIQEIQPAVADEIISAAFKLSGMLSEATEEAAGN